MLFFALLIFIVNAAENNSFDNASIGNESNSSTFTAAETSEQADAANSDIITSIVVIEDSRPSESSEPSVNANSQTSEEKSKAVTASFGVYLEIVG